MFILGISNKSEYATPVNNLSFLAEWLLLIPDKDKIRKIIVINTMFKKSVKPQVL